MNVKKRIKKITKILIVYITTIIITLNMFAINVHANEDILNQIKDTLKRYYIGEIPDSVLNATTIEEIFDFLGDPYTQYFTKGEFDDFLNEVDMKITSIGADLEKADDGIKIVSVFSNSPAKEAGIMPGDVICEVNGQSVISIPYSKAISLINGEEGITVNLKIIRDGNVLDFSLLPRKIPYPTVTGEIINEHIGYIHISSFGSITGEEFGEKLDELKGKNVDSYIIDLRNNPGGYLYPVLDIAGYFIGNKTSFILEDNIEGRYSIKAYVHDEKIEDPVIFLSNEFTASASELLLAAIRDYNKGFILGENTYGKGVAQGVFKLDDGSVLKTSTLKFFSPFGKEIKSTGITPDLKINMVDPLYAAELLLSSSKVSNEDICTRVKLYNTIFDINTSRIKDKNYWEAYRTILNKASYYSVLKNKEVLSTIKDGEKIIPQVSFVEIPKTQYMSGERVSFQLTADNYKNRIQYKAMLWSEESNTYTNLWNTKDGYYENWKPKGNEVFTIGFPLSKPGCYRIKIFAKRVGVLANKTLIKAMGCDYYMGEIPFVVLPNLSEQNGA